jgi:hypothetical protein
MSRMRARAAAVHVCLLWPGPRTPPPPKQGQPTPPPPTRTGDAASMGPLSAACHVPRTHARRRVRLSLPSPPAAACGRYPRRGCHVALPRVGRWLQPASQPASAPAGRKLRAQIPTATHAAQAGTPGPRRVGPARHALGLPPSSLPRGLVPTAPDGLQQRGVQSGFARPPAPFPLPAPPRLASLHAVHTLQPFPSLPTSLSLSTGCMHRAHACPTHAVGTAARDGQPHLPPPPPSRRPLLHPHTVRCFLRTR